MPIFCCDDMKNNIFDTSVSKSGSADEQEDKTIFYSPRFREYGIPVRDGPGGSASSYIQIEYCPWCGKHLPESKRDEWFETLFSLGYYSPMEDDIPEEFLTSAWYNK